VRDRPRAPHHSTPTKQAYISWIRRFILASGKHHAGQTV